MTNFVAVLTFNLLILLTANAAPSRNTTTYEEMRKMLASLTDVKSDRVALSALFKDGDAHESDLIKALDDPDRNISLRAQIVIRYLGNGTGMKALEAWYGKQEEVMRSGPIPVPLSERDYKWIMDQGDTVAGSYIYALALDGSPRARSVLSEIMKRQRPADDETFTTQALRRIEVSHPRKLISGGKDLAKLVLKNAFFINPEIRTYTSARLLGFSGNKDKALIEVYINRGQLAEEWYHVVMRKYGQAWKFLSITQIAVS
jgi:hypothetical protein